MKGKQMKYSFKVEPDQWGFECDGVIMVRDDENSDNIGAHTSEVMKVLQPIGISCEEMENTFAFDCGEKCPDVESLIKYLQSEGWVWEGA